MSGAPYPIGIAVCKNLLEFRSSTTALEDALFYVNNIGKCYTVIWNNSPKYIIFSYIFPLNRPENGDDDSSSEEHLQNSKRSRGGSYIYLQ